VSFDVFSFHPQIKAGIAAAGYTTPTPIQKQTIQPVLDGRDVLGLAQTGTGKTAAFVLPIFQRLLNGPRGKLRALILSPTRELAEQTHSVNLALGRKTGLRSFTIYGGVGSLPQIKGLKSGLEIAVACPGRLLDLMGQNEVDLSGIEILVIDEADQMFDMGFFPSLRRIMAALPQNRQTLLFSATMPAEIRGLANEFLKRPVTVEIDHTRPLESIEQIIFAVDQEGKYETLLSLLSDVGGGQVLVFTRTKHRAKRLAMQLAKTGMPATSLQGNLSQNQRQAAMDGFRSGRMKVMVATDIAARGIDVTKVSHVINYDVPDTVEAYTHRIGRTGRMFRVGQAFTLATEEDTAMMRDIERHLGRQIRRLSGTTFEELPPLPVEMSARPAPRPRTQQNQNRPQNQGQRQASQSGQRTPRPTQPQSQRQPRRNAPARNTAERQQG